MPEIILKFKRDEGCTVCPCFESDERIICHVFPNVNVEDVVPGERPLVCVAKFGRGEDHVQKD